MAVSLTNGANPTCMGHLDKLYSFEGQNLEVGLLTPTGTIPTGGWPLFVSLPGDGSSPDQMGVTHTSWAMAFYLSFSGLRAPGDSSGVIPLDVEARPGYSLSTIQNGRIDISEPSGASRSYEDEVLFHSGSMLHQYSWNGRALLQLVRDMIADPSLNINPNKVYICGFSRGGIDAFQMLLGGRDIWAGAAIAAGLPIYGGLGTSTTPNTSQTTAWNGTLGPTVNCGRLIRECARYQHIPIFMGDGTLDVNIGYANWQQHVSIMAPIMGRNLKSQSFTGVDHNGTPYQVWQTQSAALGIYLVDWLLSLTKPVTPVDPYPVLTGVV